MSTNLAWEACVTITTEIFFLVVTFDWPNFGWCIRSWTKEGHYSGSFVWSSSEIAITILCTKSFPSLWRSEGKGWFIEICTLNSFVDLQLVFSEIELHHQFIGRIIFLPCFKAWYYNRTRSTCTSNSNIWFVSKAGYIMTLRSYSALGMLLPLIIIMMHDYSDELSTKMLVGYIMSRVFLRWS